MQLYHTLDYTHITTPYSYFLAMQGGLVPLNGGTSEQWTLWTNLAVLSFIELESQCMATTYYDIVRNGSFWVHDVEYSVLRIQQTSIIH